MKLAAVVVAASFAFAPALMAAEPPVTPEKQVQPAKGHHAKKAHHAKPLKHHHQKTRAETGKN